MASRKRTSDVAPRPVPGSWMALLASATLGNGVDTVRAEVRADGLAEGGSYRLVVQSYDEKDPGPRAKPIGSVQRAVTADELRRGIQVDLLEMRATAANESTETVVAWVEKGQPDLEFDGRRARPRPDSVYGVAKRRGRGGVVQISLNRRNAA